MLRSLHVQVCWGVEAPAQLSARSVGRTQITIMEIHFAGKLTESDFRRIQMLAARKVWIVFGLIFGVMLVVNLFSGMGRALAQNPVDAVITWMPIVLVIPAIVVLQWFVMRRHWKNNRTIQQPVHGVVSDEGITWDVQDISSSKLPWHLLLRYRDTESLVLVYQALNQVFYFPRHYFSTDQDWSSFKQLVASKLPRK